MKILFEEYPYQCEDVNRILKGVGLLQNAEGIVSIGYVGYFYNPQIRDCVFILPKVLIDEKGLVFQEFKPEALIDFDGSKGRLGAARYEFIYQFVIWIYRAIDVYQKSKKDARAVYKKSVPLMGRGGRQKNHTFLDVVLAILKFYKENQNFVLFTLRNIHSGVNKINWTRTIARTSAIVQGLDVFYVNPVNKKRAINFDEELFVIYYSILQHIHDEYGFPVSILPGFELIRGHAFQRYLDGFGAVRLRQIKYKYFSDKALELWELCYAFFKLSHQIALDVNQQEYLLAKDFNIVFEAIIDELVGDKDVPGGLKDQADGKRVDHLYFHQDLIKNDETQIYYIGDSKYYKLANKVGDESVYKQYTYARNVIQYNLGLFMDGSGDNSRVPKLRDELTEGYNVIPNFFISADVDGESIQDGVDWKHAAFRPRLDAKDGASPHVTRHFDNRLFDRDTLLVSHYNVNFLHVLTLYARNNAVKKAAWKDEVRAEFRRKVLEVLNMRYSFYALSPLDGVDEEAFINAHFRELLGKVYRPSASSPHLVLALIVPPAAKAQGARISRENVDTLACVRQGFKVQEMKLGESLETALARPPDAEATRPSSGESEEGESEEGEDQFVYLPLYSLRAACGPQARTQHPEAIRDIKCSIPGKNLNPKTHFVVQADGDSMEDKIRDGALCVCRWTNDSANDGEIVLVGRSDGGPGDVSEFWMKRWKSPRTLVSVNAKYDPIVLREEDGRVWINAVFVAVVG